MGFLLRFLEVLVPLNQLWETFRMKFHHLSYLADFMGLSYDQNKQRTKKTTEQVKNYGSQ